VDEELKDKFIIISTKEEMQLDYYNASLKKDVKSLANQALKGKWQLRKM